MKKIAVAVSAALIAGSALAADVTVFGVVDTGLVYNNTDIEGRAQTDTFSMDSGVAYGSRFGFKGTEDLGNGYSVSFHLENGFSSDDGRLGQGNRLFGREARLSLNTPFGTVSAGRMGTLTSGMGTYDIFQLNGDTFDGGFTSDTIGANVWFARDRYDNMLTFVTPKFAGFTGYAQYSNGTDGADDAQTARENNRYAALGVTYENGPLTAVVAADTIIREHVTQGYIDDAQAISFGFNYDLEVAKIFFGAQYGKHEDNFAGGISDKVDGLVAKYSEVNGLNGYNLHVGASFPLACGTLNVGANYSNAEGDVDTATAQIEAEQWGLAATHTYPLSKRTSIYTGVGFRKVTVDYSSTNTEKVKAFEAALGLTHKF